MGKETYGTILPVTHGCLMKRKALRSFCLRKATWEVCRTNATKQQFKASDGPHCFSQVITNVEKPIFCLFLHWYNEDYAFHIISSSCSSNCIKDDQL